MQLPTEMRKLYYTLFGWLNQWLDMAALTGISEQNARFGAGVSRVRKNDGQASQILVQ